MVGPEPTGFLVKPFATSLGGSVETFAVCASLGEVLLVCGLGLVPFELLSSFPPRRSLCKLGVDRLCLLLLFLCLRVFSMNQCVQFFQWAMMACEGFFRTFCCCCCCSCCWRFASRTLLARLLASRASPVVTRCSVDPRDRALRSTPSLGGGIGLLCREVLADLIESLSTGGGGTSLSGLSAPWDLLASGKPGRSVTRKSAG